MSFLPCFGPWEGRPEWLGWEKWSEGLMKGKGGRAGCEPGGVVGGTITYPIKPNPIFYIRT